MTELSDRIAGLSIHPRYLLAYLAAGLLVTLSVPVLGATPALVPVFVAGLGSLGTAVYVRFGFLAVREDCPECGDRIGLGAVWCPGHGGVQPRVTHPGVQLGLLVAGTYVVGAVMGLTLTAVGHARPFGGAGYEALAGPGYGFFRTYVALYGMAAAVPGPVALGTALRLGARLIER